VIIVLDGMDATYKTTIARKLEHLYGFKVIRFPYYRKEVETKLINAKTPEEKAKIFFEDMKKVMTNINPNDKIILDRSFISTMLYQGTEISENENIPYEKSINKLYNLLKEIYDYTSIIDHIFILTVSDEEYIERTLNRNHNDNIDKAYDKLEFQRKIREKIPYVIKFLIEKGIKVNIIDTTGKTSNEIIEKEILPAIIQF